MFDNKPEEGKTYISESGKIYGTHFEMEKENEAYHAAMYEESRKLSNSSDSGLESIIGLLVILAFLAILTAFAVFIIPIIIVILSIFLGRKIPGFKFLGGFFLYDLMRLVEYYLYRNLLFSPYMRLAFSILMPLTFLIRLVSLFAPISFLVSNQRNFGITLFILLFPALLFVSYIGFISSFLNNITYSLIRVNIPNLYPQFETNTQLLVPLSTVLSYLVVFLFVLVASRHFDNHRKVGIVALSLLILLPLFFILETSLNSFITGFIQTDKFEFRRLIPSVNLSGLISPLGTLFFCMAFLLGQYRSNYLKKSALPIYFISVAFFIVYQAEQHSLFNLDTIPEGTMLSRYFVIICSLLNLVFAVLLCIGNSGEETRSC